MGSLTKEERDQFSWSLRGKNEKQLKTLFNELTAESADLAKADAARGRALEKAEIVKGVMDLRHSGGAIG